MDRKVDGQKDRWTERQMDRKTDGQKGRWTNWRRDREIDIRPIKRMHLWMIRRKDYLRDRCIKR
jgi:hypothetical protein